MKQNYMMDLHTHTIASGHAYNTINEMIRSAADKNLALLGISEHGPAMGGAPHPFYFQNIGVLAREKYGIQVRYGVELNIIDYNGKIDLDERSLRDLDYAIASLHPVCVEPGSKKENTMAYVKAMEHPKVRIIGHPDDGRFPADYEELVREAKRHDVWLELNNSSLNPNGFRANAYENDKEILRLCIEHGTKIILGSDAHCEEDVANFERCQKLLDEMAFPKELVANYDTEGVEMWMKTEK